MPNLAHLQELLRELGPLVPEVQELHQSEDELSWAIAWEDDVVVFVEAEEGSDRVTLRSEIGPMPEEASFASVLLRFNGLWHQTGGICLGVDEEVIVMHHDVSVAGMETPVFCEIIAGFADKTRTWTQLLVERAANPSPAPDATLETADDMMRLFGSGIRA